MSEIRPPDGSHAQDEPFVVVGLGASAGGLEALDAFFSGLPTTDSCAFVVVVHLSPDHESEMAEILGRTVPVPVVQVSERVRVEKGHVYVIPPNRNLHIEDSHLWLTPLESARNERRPIDYFFRTLGVAWVATPSPSSSRGRGTTGPSGSGPSKRPAGSSSPKNPRTLSTTICPGAPSTRASSTRSARPPNSRPRPSATQTVSSALAS